MHGLLLFQFTMGSISDSGAAVVFTPALGETLAVGKSSLILSATSAGPVELFAQIGDIDSAFKPVDVECLSGGLQTYQVSLDTDCCSPQDPTEVSIFHHANGGRQLLGKISLVQYQEPKPLRLQFCTTILLDEEDEFKSQRLEWLEHDQWEGWVWYRPRDTWIEASFTSLREISSQSPIHSLLLRSTPRSAHPQSVLAVFPASTAAAFVNLSAAGPGEVPGIYARVRRVKQGGKAEIVVTGDLRHHNGTVAAIPGAIDQARKQYGLSTAPFQTDADSGNPFNSLGFCTWSSIGENVPLTYELMKNLVESLRRDNAPISTFIVDDGWQDIRKGHNGSAGSRGLWSFGTWPGMGCTLSETVDLIKDTLPTVRDVGVWMTLYGYWNSIAPDSPLTKKYEMRSFHLNQDRVPGILRPPGASDSQQLCCSTDPKDHVYCLPPKNRAYDFWKDYFAFCAAAGVSFVKVDNQAYGSYLDGVEGGEEFVAMWNGMVNAANTVFGENRVIHCMAHYERMFNGDIGLGAATNGKKIVIRNSDDFGLHRPNVHRDHVLYNIYNALLTSNLCFVPDADMFMTSAQWPDYHATLRAFFDGPVLLADKPGSHDPRILGKMIGLSPQNGRYEVIKPERAIRPLGRNVWERFLAAGVGPALKGASYFPDCGSANIVLWNCRAGACDDAVDLILTEDLADALELSTGSESVDLAVWASNAEKARSMTVNTSTAENASSLVISTRLPPKAVEVLTIAPYHALGGISIANLGLIDKYAGLVSIGNSEVSGTRLSTKIRHQGILGFLVSRFVDGESDLRVTVDGRAVHFTVERQSKELHLVQVDLSKASPSLRKDHYAVDIGFW